jgi:hypothetical protein
MTQAFDPAMLAGFRSRPVVIVPGRLRPGSRDRCRRGDAATRRVRGAASRGAVKPAEEVFLLLMT